MCLPISSWRRGFWGAVLLVLGLAGLGSPARAQPEVTWEKVGDLPHDSSPLPLSVGTDGSLLGAFNDLLLIDGQQVFFQGLYRLAPPYDSTTAWENVSEPIRSGPQWTYVVGRDTLLISETTHTYRSLNGGGQWDEIANITFARRILEISSGPYRGRLIAVRESRMVSFSDDRGATWQEAPSGFDAGDPPTVADSADAQRVAVVTTGPHAGRLVAVGLSGLTTSDDGGYTWQATSEFAYFQQRSNCMATLHGQAADGGDRLLTVMNDIRIPDDSVRVIISDDGGETWTRIQSLMQDGSRTCVEVVDLGDGRAVAVMRRGPLWWTDDAGETWSRWAEWNELVPPEEAQMSGVGEARWAFVGPDGRLYVGLFQGGGDVSIHDKRSSEPVASWAVSSEPQTEKEETRLRVSPNPSRQRVTVELVDLTSPSAEVVIVDAQGREVARRVLAGESRWRLDVSAWAPGVYRARAVGKHPLATVSFTVVR
ncbi:MAG: hypothetical protein AAF170_08860 [Bacteroidota bacterium]